jgi:spore maturation protein CgeB
LETPKTRRVALIGSDRSDRRQLARDLDRYGIELELISGVFREQYIDTLASAKIVVNQNPAEGRGLLNMRWFETPAAGSLIIGEESDRTANSPFKDIGIGYVNVCDLAAECDYYLSNPEELKKKTKQLQDHVFQHHTYENRCQQILDWYAETR